MSYITVNDLYTEFGKENVRKWADVSGEKRGDIDGRIAAAITEAEGILEDKMRGGRYTIPLVFLGGIVSATIKRIVRGMVLDTVYFARGLADTGDAEKYRPRIDESSRLLEGVLTGSIRIDCQLSVSASRHSTSAPYVHE